MNEFDHFNSATPVTPPRHLTETILSRVHRDLNPSFWRILAKLSAIHAVLGTLTVLFCPQFGISPLSHMGLYGVFMRWGPHACMIGCGAVFMGGSLLVASLILRPEEVRAIRSRRLLQVSLLSLLSMGVFICSGAVIVVELGALWYLGSILGGTATLELGWALRRKVMLA